MCLACCCKIGESTRNTHFFKCLDNECNVATRVSEQKYALCGGWREELTQTNLYGEKIRCVHHTTFYYVYASVLYNNANKIDNINHISKRISKDGCFTIWINCHFCVNSLIISEVMHIHLHFNVVRAKEWKDKFVMCVIFAQECP